MSSRCGMFTTSSAKRRCASDALAIWIRYVRFVDMTCTCTRALDASPWTWSFKSFCFSVFVAIAGVEEDAGASAGVEEDAGASAGVEEDAGASAGVEDDKESKDSGVAFIIGAKVTASSRSCFRGSCTLEDIRYACRPFPFDKPLPSDKTNRLLSRVLVR